MHTLSPWLLGFLLTLAALPATAGEPSPEPVLRLETGMHTAAIRCIGVDAEEKYLLTASRDKTLRLWNLEDGALLQVYRPPIGAGNEGKLYAGAISPDGMWVAGAGWTGWEWEQKVSIYLFDRAGGQMLRRLSGLENVVRHLCFSPDNRYLAATLGGKNGVRVWTVADWREVFRDTDYGDSSPWCDFDPQNRLVTSSRDGSLRLYAPKGEGFSRQAQATAPGGEWPYAAAFSPDGGRVAVGFSDSTQVNVLDGRDLSFLYAPDSGGLEHGGFSLNSVAWSLDGGALYAGGGYYDRGDGSFPVMYWPLAGQGARTAWPAATDTLMHLWPLQQGRLVYGAADPAFGVLAAGGAKWVERRGELADFRGNREGFLISQDGMTIQYQYQYLLWNGEWSAPIARFSVSHRHLQAPPASEDPSLLPPDTESLDITDWKNTYNPALNGNPLPLETYEQSRALAIAPDRASFVLGAEWSLRRFDRQGQLLWKVPVPGTTWGVNISGDGRIAMAAFSDGTLRWYRLEDGAELLAMFPHKSGQLWVAWTPSGYYMSSGDQVDQYLGWHMNQGKDQAAVWLPASALYKIYKRPDVVTRVLETLDEAEALRLANLAAGHDGSGEIDTGKEVKKAHEDRYKFRVAPSELGKAVIAATAPAHDKLFPYSDDATQKMYRLLFDLGFSDGDILFLNPNSPRVPYDADPNLARQDFALSRPGDELAQAMTLATRDLRPGQQFVFYLHGHARQNALQLGNEDRREEIGAQTLKYLLAQIPAGVEQIIILDTCHAGSFLDELAGVENRVVVTSSDAESKTWSFAEKSFAAEFIRFLKHGASLGEAFTQAEQKILGDPQSFGAQRPQLDDNSDGRYAADDGSLAWQIRFGKLRQTPDAAHSALPPEITAVHPTIHLAPGQGEALLWVQTFPGMDGINKVRAVLRNEHDRPPEYQGMGTDFTLREITLSPNFTANRFEATFDGFGAGQNWRINYQAQSMEGDWSAIAQGYAVTPGGSVALRPGLNQGAFQIGEPLRFDLGLDGTVLGDLYAGVILPDGNFLTVTGPGQFSALNSLEPYFNGLQLNGEQTLSVLNFPVPPVPAGTYQVCALLTWPGSQALNAHNWLDAQCLNFGVVE